MNNFNLHIYQKSESTNMLVKNRIDAGEREGYAALAFEQSAGYGRMKRAWASPAGGLYLSVLLRPSVCVQVMPTISFLVALSVRRALLRFLPSGYFSRIKLKWPNDIVFSGSLDNSSASITAKPARQFRKLVGISQELIHGALCIGIGANVFRPSVPQNITGKNTPVYIEDMIKCASTESAVIGGISIKTVSAKNSPIKIVPTKTHEKQDYIVELAHAILEELQPAYGEWCARGFEPFVEEYQQHMCLVGSQVQMNNQLGECVLEGEVMGIDSAGCILIKHAKGITHQPSGEVSLLLV